MKVWCVWIHENLLDIYQFLSLAERFLISFLYSVPFFRSLNHAGSLVSLQRPLLHYSLPSQPSHLSPLCLALFWVGRLRKALSSKILRLFQLKMYLEKFSLTVWQKGFFSQVTHIFDMTKCESGQKLNWFRELC